MNIKGIVKLFNINPNYLIKKEDKSRWINVLRELEQYEYEEIKGELEAIMDLVPDKDRYYYLESVRRNLNIKTNNDRKREGYAVSIRSLFK